MEDQGYYILGSLSLIEGYHLSNFRAVLPLANELSESAGPYRSLSICKWAPFPFSRVLLESKGTAHFIRATTYLVFGLV